MDPVPPVIDVTRQVRIESALQEAAKKTLFSPINIIAFVVLLCVLFFLFKRYKDKKATEKAHSPSDIIR
jgi:hypothetical protein